VAGQIQKKAGRLKAQSRVIEARPPETVRLVFVVFHSDHYKGRCELMNPFPQYESGTRYFETLYESEPVRKMEGEDLWICGFPQRTIQPGQYVLAA
jgi:hypothetical protein